ncbi:MAG: cytidine deaminase [Thermoleophilia bacterium]|nr:cytidine deaminase [Thermoleophilia bacterium]
MSAAAHDQARNLDIDALFQRATEATEHAYAPYSHLHVGAALLTSAGHVITGSNLENASYGSTICAERVAVGRAVAEGHRQFQAIAVAIESQTDWVSSGVCCGSCLQVLAEFAPQGDLLVIFPQGHSLQVACLSDLIPVRFTAADS